MEAEKSTAGVEGLGLAGTSTERPALGYLPTEDTPRETESDDTGFSGTCQTTLTDWIQLVQLGRRDAVVKVRTHDGKSATLWCRAGDIVDAACDGVTGEDAVYRALSWQGGKVSVDFKAVQRPRRIEMSTAGLLLEAAYMKDSCATTTPDLPSAWPPRRRPTALIVLAGGVGALLLLVGLVSKGWIRVFIQPRAATMLVPEFVVRVDTDPGHATLFLDGAKAGVGHLEKALPRDGRTHVILASVPGHVSERRIFRDTPPPRRLTLSPIDDAAVARPLPVTEVSPSLKRASTRPTGSARPPRRRNAVTTPPRRTSAPSRKLASPTLSPGDATPAKTDGRLVEQRAPRIEIIEERSPRIQVIGGGNPRIEVLE